MKRPAAVMLLLALLAVSGGAEDAAPPLLPPSISPATSAERTLVTFVPVDVFIDPQGQALACYQVEIAAIVGDVKLIGIQGGDAGFEEPPYYDPRALQSGRVIIGAYTLAGNPPTHKTRVATLNFMISGRVAPQYQATLRVAGSSNEKSIPAVVSLAPRGKSQ
jgi:hypothetical protein